MHPFVKILIVVNLLFAVGFWAYTASALGTTDNYKKQLETARAEAQERQDELGRQLQEARTELQLAREGRSTADERANQEKARADNLESQLAEEKRASTQLRDDITKINNTLGDINATIAQISAEKDRAVEAMRAAEEARDEALAAQQAAEMRMRDATGGMSEAEARISDLEAQLAQIQSDLSRRDAQLATIVAQTGVSLDDIIAQPDIEGAVLAINTSIEPGLVVLNVGEAAGVKRGMTFEIYAGDQYKGQVRVQSVLGDRSSALITRQGTAPIARGDRAATRL